MPYLDSYSDTRWLRHPARVRRALVPRAVDAGESSLVLKEFAVFTINEVVQLMLVLAFSNLSLFGMVIVLFAMFRGKD